MVDDERLLAELAEAERAAAAVPAPFVDIGKAAFAWRNVTAELAELTADSADDPAGAFTGARGDPASLRTLTFVAGDSTIEVELTAAALQGHIVPAGPGEIDVEVRDGQVDTVPVDDDGWFLARCPARLFRLHLRRADGSTAVTVWTAPW